MAVAFVSALFFGLLANFAVERIAGSEQVVRGVKGLGQSLSGLDREGVLRRLRQANAQLAQRRFVLRLDEAQVEKTGSELHLAFDEHQETRAVLDVGRSGALPQQFAFWLARLFTPWTVTPTPSVDPGLLREALGSWVNEVVAEPRPPSLFFAQELVVDEGAVGRSVDYPSLSRRLAVASISAEDDPVVVPFSVAQRLVPEAVLQRVRAEADELVRAPLTFVVEMTALAQRDEATAPAQRSSPAPEPIPSAERSLELELDPHQFGPALSTVFDATSGSFELVFSTQVLRQVLAPLLSRVEASAKDAQFAWGPGGAMRIVPSTTGVTLDESRLPEQIFEAARSGSRRVSMPLSITAPRLSTERAEGLGIKGLVATFTTRYQCCQPRVDNIRTAAARLDGTVLLPGERFSLNDRLGPRRASAGYRKAPTIVRGEMKEMLGGGISQLATTLFNAALRGGYAIIQRQPHSVYFPRYPEGHEATVSYPVPDLIFENDSPAGLVIRAHFAETFIKVELYGDNGGRSVRLSKSKRSSIVAPPIEYEADDRLEPEERKVLVAGQLGWTVVVSREIVFGDSKKKTEKREVTYSPRAQLIRVHSCNIPEGFEGHTGDKCPEPERDEREEELSDGKFYETIPLEYDEGG